MRSGRVSAAHSGVIALAAGLFLPLVGQFHGSAGSAFGFVPVGDRCPMPTPYPPPGAAVGTVRNPGFEAGFVNGVANGWSPFKDEVYAERLHHAGTDRPYAGDAAQRLVLPQPPDDDRFAGLYQQIWVVPGGTYTATMRVYLDPPALQTYNGEDLGAWLGLDPYGEATADGRGTIWSEEAASPRTWVTLTVTARAVLPVMTVSLRAGRKFSQHGNDAQVWFDSIRLVGPAPTGQPPGPEPDPVDPGTLLPRTIGRNLIGNPSFEQPFLDGVSAGWNKWALSGDGIWRQSRRVGKVGGGYYDCGTLAGLAEMNPKTILLYGGTPSVDNPNDAGGDGTYPEAAILASEFPQLENSIIIGRPALDSNWETYKTNPAFYGRQLAEQLWIKQQQFPRIDCWQGLNEPDTGAGWQAVLVFEKAFADRAHELGMKVVSLNLGGTSLGNDWLMVDETYEPSCRSLLAVADYLGHHCYGGPNDDLMVTNQSRDNACDFALRPRRFHDLYARRGWRFPPVIATEGSTWGSWHGNWSPETIANDLIGMGAYMDVNRWWCGYTNFVAGGSCGWGGFEIIGQGSITRDVGAWNVAHPADAVDGGYSQMFGAGRVHPIDLIELAPAGQFVGGVNRQVTGLTPGCTYLASCWIKYEFRGHQPTQLGFHIGVDTTGQIGNADAITIDWGVDQLVENVTTHEVFTRVWRTFVATNAAAGIWLRADHPLGDPSFMFYVDAVNVRQLTGSTPAPVLEIGPTRAAVTVPIGTEPSAGSFTVRNASGAGTLAYSIADDAEWLSIEPAAGTSTGEADTIMLRYAVTGLRPGSYTARVTIDAAGVSNAPLGLTVQLTITTARSDFDRDGDVDELDFGAFQSCLSASAQDTLSEDCRSADLDDDGDVDLADFVRFQECIGGEGRPIPPGCLR